MSRGGKPEHARMSEAEYRAALEEIESLMDAERGTPEGGRLGRLVEKVRAYEARRETLWKAYAEAAQDPEFVEDLFGGSSMTSAQTPDEAQAFVDSKHHPERDELGELFGRAVADEIRRMREVGANVVLNIEGFPVAVPATEVRLKGEGPGQSILEWCRHRVEEHPLPVELVNELRRIFPQESVRLAWLCSYVGSLGGRPLERWNEDPAALLEEARRAAELGG